MGLKRWEGEGGAEGAWNLIDFKENQANRPLGQQNPNRGQGDSKKMLGGRFRRVCPPDLAKRFKPRGL